ncbi:MAG TPA: VOC family protein [Gemmatimonadales bacterium]|nr:VOC family protein [Gemmatimonadales bacterium]
MTPLPTPGRFCWHELMTTDPAGAMTFYGKLAGWTTETHANDPSYHLWKARGKVMIGGVMELPQKARQMGSPSSWVPYIEVTDVDETVRRATAMGGRTFVSPGDIPQMGRFAVLGDNQGATFAVYRGNDGISPDPEPGMGEFSWHEMIAGNLDTAWTFYHALFGWEKREAMDMGAAGIYQVFRNAGGTRDLGGMYTKPKDLPAAPHWLCYVNVPSAAKSGEFTTKNGGKVLMGPMEVPGGGHIINGMDPQGAAFATFEPPKARKKAAKKKKKKAPAKKAKGKSKKVKKKAKKRR